MKAIIYTKYGSYDQLKLVDMLKPSPKEDEVLIKVASTSINKSDVLLLKGRPLMIRMFQGLFKPSKKRQILGGDVSGVVEAIGGDVKMFEIGDHVFGDLSDTTRGAMAEFVCTKEKYLACAPSNILLTEASAAPLGCLTALQAIRSGQLKEGEEILINGASGSVGSYAVQIAKAYGAKVTAVCSTKHIDMAKKLGADEVIDYKEASFVNQGKTYDLILGVNGYQTLKEYLSCLKETGSYVMIGGTGKQIFEAMLLKGFVPKGQKKIIGMGAAKQSQSDLNYIKSLFEEGKLINYIDRIYPLQGAKDAYKHAIIGHPSSKIIIKITN